MANLEISSQELTFLVGLLTCDRQTALQLLAAEHVYRPSLLPRMEKLQAALKRQAAEQRDRDDG
jgi:hypothetical protein